MEKWRPRGQNSTKKFSVKKIQPRILIFKQNPFIESKGIVNVHNFYEADFIKMKNCRLYFFLRIFLFAASLPDQLDKSWQELLKSGEY